MMKLFRNKKITQQSKTHYFDYAAATPCAPKVLEMMQPYFAQLFANPSSIHKAGVVAKQALESARENAALQLGVKKEEITFVSGGTESCNMFVLGVVRHILTDESFTGKPHIITSTIEHPAVLEPIAYLAQTGCEVTYLSPNKKGVITADTVKAALRKNTILVSVALVNGEIGTIQPIRKIAKTILQYKREEGRIDTSFPYMHTDAAQAPLIMSIKFEKFGVDAMSLDASKFYGPKYGILCKKKSVPLQPLLYGGSQEHKLRPGTENLPYIVGTAHALQLAQNQETRHAFVAAMQACKDYFITEIARAFPEATINGTFDSNESSPLITNVCFAEYDIDAEFLVLQLDAKGIAVSAMTACKSLDDLAHSYVVAEVADVHKESSTKKDCAGASIRFSFGITTTKKEIDYVVQTLQNLLL